MKRSRTIQAHFPTPNQFKQQRVNKGKPITGLVVLTLIVLPLLASLQMFLQLSVVNGQLVVGGIPFSIVATFLQDDRARTAYLHRNRHLLHDRLETLGVEEQIKAFYRPQISDELALDQYIHQIFYDRTGYVGLNYRVNSDGVLVLKKGRIP